MDGLLEFLGELRDRGMIAGRLRGFLHVVIGRRIETAGGKVISQGVTWRDLADVLMALKLDKKLVLELGVEPDDLAARDRKRFWYSAIALAKPDSAESRLSAEGLIQELEKLGYRVGPPPKSGKG